MYAVGLSTRERGVAREAAQTGGAHGDDDAQVAAAVGVKEQEDGSAAAGGEAVPDREVRGSVCAQIGYRGLEETRGKTLVCCLSFAPCADVLLTSSDRNLYMFKTKGNPGAQESRRTADLALRGAMALASQ